MGGKAYRGHSFQGSQVRAEDKGAGAAHSAERLGAKRRYLLCEGAGEDGWEVVGQGGPTRADRSQSTRE